MTEKLKQYAAFIVLTDERYEHCTLLEKMSVYVQHVPASIVPFLVEMIDEVERLREELDELHSAIIDLKDANFYGDSND